MTVKEVVTENLSSYDAPVTIEAPPASQTYNATGAAIKAGTTSN